MESEIRNCQNCKQQFTIESEDFNFYKKISVPPPTFCPQCRYQRRLMIRNERNLYRRECGLCKKKVVSMYSAEKPFPVYCQKCWWGDGWNPMEFGRAYDWQKPFFLQFREFQDRVPRPNLGAVNAKNSEYCNYVGDVKDSYLCFGSIEIENCLYGSPYESKYCVDTYLARECEYCYECIDCEKLSNSSFCENCSSSLGLLYCFDCKNCQDCIGCVGLRNQKYHIFNKPLSKEDYIREKEKISEGGRGALEEVEDTFYELKGTRPHRFSTILQSTRVSGDHIVYSKNARDCFDVKRTEDCAYCIRMIDAKDTHDTNYCEYLELCYEYLGFWKMARSKFSNTCGESSDLEYADLCSGSSFLFGCVGLRKKQYCILNKQYSKGEWEKMVEKIKQQMKEIPFVGNNGRVYGYGEFYPAELALLCYNESVAQDFFPLNKKEIEAAGLKWKEPEERHYAVTIKSDAVPGKIQEVSESVLEQIIECSHKGECKHQCTTAFKIIPPELQFYRQINLPLPQLCPNCRHYRRLRQRNPTKLWTRKCQCAGAQSENGVYKNSVGHFHGDQRCPNEFETSYAPERPEIVYCEDCYQQEIS